METMKEAAKRVAADGGPFSIHKQNYEYMFWEGADWQKDQSGQMWTDEDMLNAFKAGVKYDYQPQNNPTGDKWIQQYKEKKDATEESSAETGV